MTEDPEEAGGFDLSQIEGAYSDGAEDEGYDDMYDELVDNIDDKEVTKSEHFSLKFLNS